MSTRISSSTLIIPDGVITNAAVSSSAAIDTSKMAQRVLAEYPISFGSLRTWDAWTSGIPSTPASDDLGLITGTLGTNFPNLQTGDLKAAGSTSRKVGFEVVVPPNYDDAETFQIRIRAGMLTTVADTAATVDLAVYASDLDGAPGADLCATAAQSCNSLTLANYDFTITASSLDPSMLLQCVITFLVNDAATGTAVTGTITDIRALVDTRG